VIWSSRKQNVVRAARRKVAVAMSRAILKAREAGDSLGGVIEILASGIPAGLGDPVMGQARRLPGLGAHVDRRGQGLR